jgi:hypothetical protein
MRRFAPFTVAMKGGNGERGGHGRDHRPLIREHRATMGCVT